MMPLAMAVPGESVRLVAIHAGRGVCKRLADLGLTPGTLLRVVQGDGWGPLIVMLKDDTRLALGRGMALHILVEPSKIECRS